ncbi:MAG: hypothetical protein M3433_04470 [Actinomycetota bacterium]|nr:hypothetical protein [Actinomycetota bacterium]
MCAELRPRITGRVDTSEATELSGLATSQSQPGVLWAHNDSGAGPLLLALAPDGRLRGEVAVTRAENRDWEDISLGPGPGGRDALFVADIGDNDAQRPTVIVYRVPEPGLSAGAPSASAPAGRLTLRYPDGAHDAEALLVDPSDGTLAVVTKSFGGDAFVYVADRPRAGTVTGLRRAGRVPVPAGEAVTAGDVSADGRTIVLRTYDRALVWSRRRGQSLAAALRREPCAAGADLAGEGQGEALALTPDGRAFFTVPEGRRPALRRYAPGR